MDNKINGIIIYDDNNGKTWDRYTVILDGSVYGMSTNALQADGFNQYNCEESELRNDRDALGKEIQWEQLPEEVQKAINQRAEALA